MKPIILFILFIGLNACTPQTEPDLFDQIRSHCGQAFSGEMTSDDPRDADFAKEHLIIEVRHCSESEIRIPFHVGEDHSRTFILTRVEGGVQFKHDHRHEDGEPDRLSMYGGTTLSTLGSERAEFPADLETKALFERAGIPQSKDNIWSLTLDETSLTYALNRPNRYFAARFDLSNPVDLPPAPWGEGLIADKVFTGGPIYTGVEHAPTAEFIAVLADRIIFAGDEIAGRVLQDETTQNIDLNGASLFPGFTDSHIHVLGVGLRQTTLNLENISSISELLQELERAADHSAGPVITGRGWIETHWPEARFPTASDLDKAVSERPVILLRADGHALVANSLAMQSVGVDARTADPEGGTILRDESGQATGMFVDTAMTLFAPLMGQPQGKERADLYELGGKVLASYGWTGVHDMGVPGSDIEILEQVLSEDRFPIRIMPYLDPDQYEMAAARVGKTPIDHQILDPGVKFYMDGALGSRGAALLSPYEDSPGETGLFLIQETIARTLMDQALKDGVQLAGHAIGDAGNKALLDWMEASFAAVPKAERQVTEPRWRVEHAQILKQEDIPRFAELGVIASMQPSHAIGDLHFAPARIGYQRLDGAYAWRSLIESGAIIAGGSDAPVERGEARIEFYAAAVRRDLKGYAGQGWNLDQALERETALKLFTIWPAYATGREEILGTIEAGKLADFSIFDRDLMTVPDEALKDAKPVMTVVGGKIVFEADG